MATGENFKRICWNKNKIENVKLNKKEEQIVNIEIKKLQDQISLIYNDDNLTDEEVKIQTEGINNKINELINSKY